MLGIGAIPSVILAVGVLAMPESPRWLVMKGRLGDATKVLNKTSDSEQEAQLRLMEIKAAAGIPENCNDDVVTVNRTNEREGSTVWKELFLYPTPAVRHIVIAALGIHFFQQASGIDAVVLYSPTIFRKAGLESDTEQLLATMAVGLAKTVFILVATFMLDRVGRRPLLLSSVGGMVISLLTLAVSLTVVDHSHVRQMWAVGLSIASVLSYVATFSIGAGPITWVYSSEIFPLQLRAQGASAGVVVNRVTSGVISMTFLSLSDKISIGGAFFLFGGIAACGWIFFYTLLPETQGKTLEEMEGSFGKFWGKSNTNNDNGEIQFAN
jgi:MFS family permease